MTRGMNRTLWTVQGILALLYLFTGAMKLILPIAVMTQQIAWPGAFLRFIGATELLGAAGLVLPGLLRMREELTPLAASGLAIIMIGATVATYTHPAAGSPLLPAAVGLLDCLVAWKRRGAFEFQRRNPCLSPSLS